MFQGNIHQKHSRSNARVKQYYFNKFAKAQQSGKYDDIVALYHDSVICRNHNLEILHAAFDALVTCSDNNLAIQLLQYAKESRIPVNGWTYILLITSICNKDQLLAEHIWNSVPVSLQAEFMENHKQILAFNAIYNIKGVIIGDPRAEAYAMFWERKVGKENSSKSPDPKPTVVPTAQESKPEIVQPKASLNPQTMFALKASQDEPEIDNILSTLGGKEQLPDDASNLPEEYAELYQMHENFQRGLN